MSSKAEIGPAVQRAISVSPSLVGRMGYYLYPFRRSEILSNIQQVFGDALTTDQTRRLAQSFYSHFWRIVGENISSIWTPQEKMASRVDIEGIEHVLEAAESGKGILILTGHFGNWEMATVGAIRQFQKYEQQLHVVRKGVGWGAQRFVFDRFQSESLRQIVRERLRLGDQVSEHDRLNETGGAATVRLEATGIEILQWLRCFHME